MKPKVYLQDYNGILQGVKKREEIELVDDPRDCDVILTWQDVRKDMLELAKINKEYWNKPFIVVQHGRQATRDYGAPENFPLMADKICVWGQDDYDRMASLGYADRTVITGSPLISRIKPKETHTDRNVVFVPVRTMHEEPDNLITYWELKKIELSHSQEMLRKHKDKLIKDWNAQIVNPDAPSMQTISYHDINLNFRLVAKLTPLHEKGLYLGSANMSDPVHATHIDNCVHLLQQTDVVVCLEEGTFQTLVMAMDIPLIVVNGWRLTDFAGIDYSKDRVELATEGATRVDLPDLAQAIERELADPGRLADERKKVVQREFGDSNSNPEDNIINVVKEMYNG